MSRHYRHNYLFHTVFLLALCITPYFGTFDYGWHLDDPPNILHNTPLHITNLSPPTLINTFFASPGAPGHFFRPVSNLSFSLNWFFGQDQPFGYHLVNTGIHYFTAIALYWCCILLLQSPAFNNTQRGKQCSAIALFTSALWAMAPIHTQAVTYIVQRMAQLATLFSITALLFFLMARLATNKKKQFFFSFLFLCSSLLALGSKENAVLLPLSVLLIEYIFFFQRKLSFSTFQKNKKQFLAILLIALTGCTLLFWYYGTSLFNYEHRNFTLPERLLTEPRILIFYLSQIILPLASRLSIEHDIIISSSLFTPWQTLPAILACTGAIFFGFTRMRKNPLFSFAILFFFVNHFIESTFIPLELLFEHRNYLPSLFLFFPVSAFLVIFINNNTPKITVTKILAIAGCSGYLILSAVSTCNRNTAWANEETLWADAITKAPNSGRAKINLAKSYIEKQKYEEAFQLYEEAEQLSGATQNKLIPISLNSKGTIAYNQGNSEEALALFTEALNLRNDYTDVSYKIIQLLIELGRYKEALNLVTERYNITEDAQLLLIKGSLLLRLNNPAESLATYQTAHRFFPTSALILTGRGKALSMLGYYEQANVLLSLAMTIREPGASFLRMENFLKWGHDEEATKLLQQFIQSVPLQVLLDDMHTSPGGAEQIPYDNILIRKKIFAFLGKTRHTSSQSDKIKNSSILP